jgi:type I restriction-modification system DNA methylase subunit
MSKKERLTIIQDFQTPPLVCRYMADLVKPQAQTVLEPTPGAGQLVKALIKKGFQVTAPSDFFALEKTAIHHKFTFDAICMNPPFSAKSAFNLPANLQGMRVGYCILKKCMQMTDNIVALMPWFTLTDSDVRTRDIYSFGLRSITSLPRATFGYSRIQTCILQMERGYKGPTEFKIYEFEN